MNPNVHDHDHESDSLQDLDPLPPQPTQSGESHSPSNLSEEVRVLQSTIETAQQSPSNSSAAHSNIQGDSLNDSDPPVNQSPQQISSSRRNTSNNDNDWDLDDYTLDDQEMSAELDLFLSSSEPRYDSSGNMIDFGGLSMSPQFLQWLQELGILTIHQYIEFGRKEFILYFSMAKSITKIKPFGKYLKRTKAFIYYWDSVKVTLKTDAAFTPSRFHREFYKSIYKKLSIELDAALKHAATQYDIMLKSADQKKYRRQSMGVPTVPRSVNHDTAGYAIREGRGQSDESGSILRLQNPMVYRDRRPSTVTRKQLPTHIKVDNDFTKFHTFQIAYESYLLQNDMSYVANQRFLDLYNEVGIHNILTHFPYLQVTLPQLKVDRTSQYGALQQAIGEGHARVIIEPFYDTQDDFLAYRALLDKMVNYPTIRDIRRTHYQQILNRIYTTQYPGGIRAFCNEYVAAYQGLDKLQLPVTEEEKIANFTLHAWTPENKELISHLRLHYHTLQDITQQVYADSLKVDYYNATIAARRANLAIQDPFSMLSVNNPDCSHSHRIHTATQPHNNPRMSSLHIPFLRLHGHSWITRCDTSICSLEMLNLAWHPLNHSKTRATRITSQPLLPLRPHYHNNMRNVHNYF